MTRNRPDVERDIFEISSAIQERARTKIHLRFRPRVFGDRPSVRSGNVRRGLRFRSRIFINARERRGGGGGEGEWEDNSFVAAGGVG